jgi:hypothetical protein
MLAAAPLQPAAHVTVYGRATLPLLIALNREGCAEATSICFDAPASKAEPANLAWIANLTTETEIDKALDRACHVLDKNGRLVVDATAFRKGKTFSRFLRHLAELNLRVARLLPSKNHLIVVATPTMASA